MRYPLCPLYTVCVALVFPDTFGWFQLKCREAVCIPEGKACETDTALLSASDPLGVFVFSTRRARSC